MVVIWELWASGPADVDGGVGVDDEGMSSALALVFLFLNAICNEKKLKIHLRLHLFKLLKLTMGA